MEDLDWHVNSIKSKGYPKFIYQDLLLTTSFTSSNWPSLSFKYKALIGILVMLTNQFKEDSYTI